MKKKVLLSALGAIVLIGLLVVNWFVYPFTSKEPNFADVEAVYNKMVAPNTWVKKGEGANKGIAGRQCPIESDGCFSKVASFTIPISEYASDVESIAISMGCPSSNQSRVEQIGGPASMSFRCSSGAIIVSGSIVERGDRWDAYVYSSSR